MTRIDVGYYDETEQETKPMKCRAIIQIIYLAVGFFTWAHIYETSNAHDEEFLAVIGGIAWPLYWSGKGALAGHRYVFAKREVECQDEAGVRWAARNGVCLIQDRR